jgi:hypothetical protein
LGSNFSLSEMFENAKWRNKVIDNESSGEALRKRGTWN